MWIFYITISQFRKFEMQDINSEFLEKSKLWEINMIERKKIELGDKK